MHDPRVIVALDYDNADAAIAFCRSVSPGDCRIKVGLELFLSAGEQLIDQIQDLGFSVFLDLKFHDIPNTVARACRRAAAMGVWMLNVHALGGRGMLLAAREAVEQSSHRPLLIGVTVLTSVGEPELASVGISGTAEENVIRLAALVAEAGLDGVVCSPQEAAALHQRHGQGFILVTPGIRPVGTAAADQQRVMTPDQALAKGASYLVIGRPITQADDPARRLRDINRQLPSLASS